MINSCGPLRGRQAPHGGIADMGVAAGGAGEDDDLAVAAGRVDGGSHSLQARWVAPAERVVENHRRAAAVGTDDHGARQSGDDPKLFAGTRAELAEVERDTVERAPFDSEIVAHIDAE